MPRSRIHGAIALRPNTPSWRGAVKKTGTTLLYLAIPYAIYSYENNAE
jgi:hypothetical protein